jgi:cysteine-rich repeat protein
MKLHLWFGVSAFALSLPLSGCAPKCGDGVINAELGEQCDGGADCDAACKNVGGFCGDGVVQAGRGEECDDGNNLPGDPCNADCLNGPIEDTFTLNDIGNFLFDQAVYCDGMTTRHAVVHEKDAEDNNLRWRCGDVTDIDISGNPFGQEYCEYVAIASDGAQIDNDEPSLDAQLVAALAQPENLGATVDAAHVRMQFGVNSRDAATGLIGSCSSINGDTNEVRQASCGQAFVAAQKAGNDALAQQLSDACRGVDLLDPANFAAAEALGVVVPVEGDPGFEKHREVRACVVTPRGGGLFFRNSDTNICGRAFRAQNECQCSFPPVPNAVIGFDFSIWFTPENNVLPAECRAAKVNGEDSSNLLICDVPANEIAQIQGSAKYQNDLTSFCNDRFAKNIGMLAPLSALDDGSCQAATNFCSEFFE